MKMKDLDNLNKLLDKIINDAGKREDFENWKKQREERAEKFAKEFKPEFEIGVKSQRR